MSKYIIEYSPLDSRFLIFKSRCFFWKAFVGSTWHNKNWEEALEEAKKKVKTLKEIDERLNRR